MATARLNEVQRDRKQLRSNVDRQHSAALRNALSTTPRVPRDRRARDDFSSHSARHRPVETRSRLVSPRQTHQPTAVRAANWYANLSVEKGLILFGVGTAGALFLLFALDLLFGWPFHRVSVSMDLLFCLCSLVLMYLGWDAWRDQRFSRKNVFIDIGWNQR